MRTGATKSDDSFSARACDTSATLDGGVSVTLFPGCSRTSCWSFKGALSCCDLCCRLAAGSDLEWRGSLVAQLFLSSALLRGPRGPLLARPRVITLGVHASLFMVSLIVASVSLVDIPCQRRRRLYSRYIRMTKGPKMQDGSGR